MEIAPTTSFATDEQVQEHLEELLEDGHDEDEMKEFIETHGNSDFMCYYEDYVRMVDEYDQETVDAFIEEFDLMDVEHLEDAYYGQYSSEQEFAENFVSVNVTDYQICPIGSLSTGRKHGMTDSHGIIHS